jgi:hypothetical protein
MDLKNDLSLHILAHRPKSRINSSTLIHFINRRRCSTITRIFVAALRTSCGKVYRKYKILLKPVYK